MTAQASPQSSGRTGRALFVAGAGTGIGKTYVTAALTRALLGAGRPVTALKPLASGVPSLDDPDFLESDTALLLAAQELPVTEATVAACTPWRFTAPLAPDLAAAREGRSLSLDALVAWCERQIAVAASATDISYTPPHPEARGAAEPRRRLPVRALDPGGLLRGPLARAPQEEGEGWRSETAAQDESVLLIEGVGGVMSPVTDRATGLDWLKALRLPALLVSGSYLGAISHALTAVETLAAHGVPLAGIVVSESADAPVLPETVAQAIGRHAAAPVFVLLRDAACPEALAALV